jgi:hypothetical protein
MAFLSATLRPPRRMTPAYSAECGSFHWCGTIQFKTIPFFRSPLHHGRLNWTVPTVMNVFTLLSSSCHLRISLRIIIDQNDIGFYSPGSAVPARVEATATGEHLSLTSYVGGAKRGTGFHVGSIFTGR